MQLRGRKTYTSRSCLLYTYLYAYGILINNSKQQGAGMASLTEREVPSHTPSPPLSPEATRKNIERNHR
jgi:hypothetical protein